MPERARFLVDENLSVLLPKVAHAQGYEAIHINHYGLRKAKDWDILKIVTEEDWILVTNNASEFRGRYRKLEIHPGVIFLVPVAHDGSRLSSSRLRLMRSPKVRIS